MQKFRSLHYQTVLGKLRSPLKEVQLPKKGSPQTRKEEAHRNGSSLDRKKNKSSCRQSMKSTLSKNKARTLRDNLPGSGQDLSSRGHGRNAEIDEVIAEKMVLYKDSE